MKYLKLFEELEREPKYKIGDYVSLKITDDAWNVYTIVKIVNINSNENEEDREEREIDYHVETFYTNRVMKGQITQFWVDESEIERKATPEEIEKYELYIDTKKYNL